MSDLARLLGVEHPLIQAPMAGSQGSQLAIAVGRAGALGSVPGAMLGAEALQAELQTLAGSGLASWNLNFFCHLPPQPDAARDQRWRSALAPYYREAGLDPAAAAGGASRAPGSGRARTGPVRAPSAQANGPGPPARGR